MKAVKRSLAMVLSLAMCVSAMTLSAFAEVEPSAGENTGTVNVGHTVALGEMLDVPDEQRQSVVWSSSDETTATVENGVVTGIAEGTATITASLNDTSESFAVTVENHPIPVGGRYYVGVGKSMLSNFGGVEPLIGDGTVNFPTETRRGDAFVYGDYEYRFEYFYGSGAMMGVTDDKIWYENSVGAGWGVAAIDKTKESYGEILDEINGEQVKCLARTFTKCVNMTTAPALPSRTDEVVATFYNCPKLVEAPALPDGCVVLNMTFGLCTSLTTAPVLPPNVQSMNMTFIKCAALTTYTGSETGDFTGYVIPASVTRMQGAFQNCALMKGEMEVDADIDPETWGAYNKAFFGCGVDADHEVILHSSLANDAGLLKLASTGSGHVFVRFDVELNANGGAVNEGDVTSVIYGKDAVTLPTNVTKDGCVFGGWYDNAALTGDAVEAIDLTVNDARTYYAKWLYPVSWKNYDGETLDERAYGAGETPTYRGDVPAKAEDDGFTYVFSGWSPSVAKVTGAAEYTAQFTAVPKTIASGAEETVGGNTVTVADNGDDTTTTTVVSTTTDTNTPSEAVKEETVTTVTTEVTRDAGGTTTSVVSTTETVTTTEAVVSNTFTVTKDTVSTTTTSTTGEVSVVNVAPVEEVVTTITLTQTGTASAFADTLDASVKETTATTNTITAAQVDVASVAKSVMEDNSLTNEKNTTVNVELQLKSELTAVTDEELTFTAAPYIVATISVEGEDDVITTPTRVANEDLKADVTVKLPVPAGYASAGDTIYVRHESEDANYETATFPTEVKSDGADNLYIEIVVSHFSTFTLKKEGVYTITFDANGGTGGKTVYVAAGDTVAAPSVSRSGYTFLGWSPAVQSTATASATYVAQWRSNSTSYDTGSGSSGSSGRSSSGTAQPSITIEEEKTPLASLPAGFEDSIVVLVDGVPTALADVELWYVDVQDQRWSRNAIAYATAMGFMNGTGANKFSPELSTTRGMVSTVLYRLSNGEPVEDITFEDVTDDAFYRESSAWALENGVFVGYDDGTFRGDVNITREQLVACLYRYAAAQGYDTSDKADLSAFTDADSVSGYARDAMSWAVHHGIIKGVGDTRLAPTNGATREQLAAILMRFDVMMRNTEIA